VRVLVLGYVALAFKLWMLFDALRRRVHALWYFVVMLPAGDFVYFFAVKLRDYRVRPHAEPVQKREPLVELEQEAADSPSFHNRVRLAWALYEEQQLERAQAAFELALSSHPKDNDARYGLGLCAFERGQYTEATHELSQLVERSFAFDDHAAALLLSDALFRNGQADEACALMDEVVRSTRRIEHRVAHAKLLLRATRRDQARAVLESALREFEEQPDHMRRREGAVATEARRMLRTLGPRPA
jgi:hypothetical protein